MYLWMIVFLFNSEMHEIIINIIKSVSHINHNILVETLVYNATEIT